MSGWSPTCPLSSSGWSKLSQKSKRCAYIYIPKLKRVQIGEPLYKVTLDWIWKHAQEIRRLLRWSTRLAHSSVTVGNLVSQIWIGFGDLRLELKDLADLRKGCVYCWQDWWVNSPKYLFGDPRANLVMVPAWLVHVVKKFSGSIFGANPILPLHRLRIFQCTAMHNCPPTVLMIASLPNQTWPDKFMSHKNENLGCNIFSNWGKGASAPPSTDWVTADSVSQWSFQYCTHATSRCLILRVRGGVHQVLWWWC